MLVIPWKLDITFQGCMFEGYYNMVTYYPMRNVWESPNIPDDVMEKLIDIVPSNIRRVENVKQVLKESSYGAHKYTGSRIYLSDVRYHFVVLKNGFCWTDYVRLHYRGIAQYKDGWRASLGMSDTGKTIIKGMTNYLKNRGLRINNFVRIGAKTIYIDSFGVSPAVDSPWPTIYPADIPLTNKIYAYSQGELPGTIFLNAVVCAKCTDGETRIQQYSCKLIRTPDFQYYVKRDAVILWSTTIQDIGKSYSLPPDTIKLNSTGIYKNGICMSLGELLDIRDYVIDICIP